MHEIRIKPDFNKLIDYFPDTSAEKVKYIEEHGLRIRLSYSDEKDSDTHKEPYQIDLDYTTEKQLSALYNGLRKGIKFKHYSYVKESVDEVILLALLGNERLGKDFRWYIEFYEGDKKAKEIAKLLLHCKKVIVDKTSSILFKGDTKSRGKIEAVSLRIADENIMTWIYDLIYRSIVSAKFPLGAFGGQVYSHLDINPFGTTTEIDFEKIDKTANLNLKSPNVQHKRLLMFLCADMLRFLRKHTILNNKPKVRLTNDQANFFYDLLCVLGHLNRDDHTILGRDYMHTLFKNK
jgi:hypothetical protein